eukprot:TRINITY_DN838_c1_g2_i4.p2 TRINITY_DN838_c1_g2~~TRINITY_DN838_c1_g2_i4.p2  ORF type:complete len:135 (-),score=20.56 TRINITY_DN838_c1_g2_i4:51-455(-)
MLSSKASPSPNSLTSFSLSVGDDFRSIRCGCRFFFFFFFFSDLAWDTARLPAAPATYGSAYPSAYPAAYPGASTPAAPAAAPYGYGAYPAQPFGWPAPPVPGVPAAGASAPAATAPAAGPIGPQPPVYGVYRPS